MLTYGGDMKFLYALTATSATSVLTIRTSESSFWAVLDQLPLKIVFSAFTGDFELTNPYYFSSYVFTSGVLAASPIRDGGLLVMNNLYFYGALAIKSAAGTWLVHLFNTQNQLFQDYKSLQVTINSSEAICLTHLGSPAGIIVGGSITKGGSSYSTLTLLNSQYYSAQGWGGQHFGFNKDEQFRVTALNSSNNRLYGCSESTSVSQLNLRFFRVSYSGSFTLQNDFTQVNLHTGSTLTCLTLAVKSDFVYSVVDQIGSTLLLLVMSIQASSMGYYQMNAFPASNYAARFSEYPFEKIMYSGSTNIITNRDQLMPDKVYSKQQGFLMIVPALDSSTCLNHYPTIQTGTVTPTSTTTFYLTESLSKATLYHLSYYSTVSTSANITTLPDSRSWCSPKTTYSLIAKSIPDFECLTNQTYEFEPPTVTGNTSTCLDLDQVRFRLIYSNSTEMDTDKAGYTSGPFSTTFMCLNYNLSQAGIRVFYLKVFSSETQLDIISFNVVYTEKCGSNVALNQSLVQSIVYKIGTGSLYYSYPSFSIMNTLDPLHCYAQPDQTSVLVSPSICASTLYMYWGVLYIETSDYSAYTGLSCNLTVTQPLNIQDYNFTVYQTINFTDNCDLAIVLTRSVTPQIHDIDMPSFQRIATISWDQDITYCDTAYPLVYQYSVSPSTSVINCSFPHCNVDTNDLNDIGEYQINIIAASYYSGGAQIQTLPGFLIISLSITNSCPTMGITPTSLVPSHYIIGTPEQNLSFANWIPEFTFCSTPTYSAIFFDGKAINYYEFIVFDNSTQRFTLSTSNLSLAGDYLVNVTGIFPNGSSTTTTYTIQIIDPCPTASLSVVPSSALYELYSGWQTLYANTYYSSESASLCGDYVYSYDFGALTPYVQFSPDSSAFALILWESSFIGSFDISVSVYQGNSSMNALQSYLPLQVVDLCQGIEIQTQELGDQIYNVSDLEVLIQIPEFSTIHQYCNNFTLIVSLENGTQLDSQIFTLSLDNYQISVSTHDPLKIGIYQALVTASLPFNLSVLSYTFQIVIKCRNRLISSPDPYQSLIYYLGTGRKIIQIQEFSQFPLCGYNFTYSLSSKNQSVPILSPQVLKVNQELNTIYLETNSLFDVGMHYIGVNGTLNDEFSTSFLASQIDILIAKEAPHFVQPLQDQLLFAGQQFSYQLPSALNQFSQASLVSCQLESISFASLNQLTSTINFSPQLSHVGTYTIKLTVTDPQYSQLYQQYILSISIKPPVPTELNSSSLSNQTSLVAEKLMNSSGSASGSSANYEIGQFQRKNSSSENQIPSENDIIPRIKMITKSGEVQLLFSEFIQNGKKLNLLEKSDLLRLSVIPSALSDGNSLTFTWKIDASSSSDMKLLLFFDQPLQVSRYDSDSLQIVFLNSSYFSGINRNNSIREGYTIRKKLPCMIKNDCKLFLSLSQHSVLLLGRLLIHLQLP